MGRMMNRLLRQHGIQVINIVRKEDQADALREKYGTPEQGNHVLNSEVQTFQEDLKKLAHKLNATVVLECISGPIVGVISSCLPEKSTIICYGQLSEKNIEGIDPLSILGKQLKLESFLLSTWMREKSLWATYSLIKQARLLVEEVVINKSYGLHQIQEALSEYRNNMGKGKILLKPSLTE